MYKGLPAELQHKKEVYRKWKHRWAAQEEYRDIAWACRAGVRKAKAQLELKPDREVKVNRKGCRRYTGSKRKAEENMGPLLHGAGDTVTKDMEKAEVLIAVFAMVFTDMVCP